MLKLRIEQAMGCTASSGAGPPSTAGQVDAGAQAQAEAALTTGRRHSPGGAAHCDQHHAHSFKEKERERLY